MNLRSLFATYNDGVQRARHEYARTLANIDRRERERIGTTRPRPQAEHGTLAGVNRHQRNGEAACPACAQARRDYQRAWNAARRAVGK